MNKLVKIRRVIRETSDAVTLEFENDPVFSNYRPGQFLNLFYLVNNDWVSRSYSFSSSPAVDPHPAVTIKRIPGGALSGRLIENVRENEELLVSEPSGRFELQEIKPNDHLVFLAGGSGITPLFSMIKTVLELHADVQLTLLYGNRDLQSIIFRDQLHDLEAQNPGRFRVVHFLQKQGDSSDLTTVEGYIGIDHLEGLVNQPSKPTGYYLCGPEAMMNAITAQLHQIGVEASRIHTESYAPKSSDIPSEMETGGTSLVTFRRGEEVFTLDLPRNKYILQASLDLGVHLPHSCKEAMCGTCRVKLISGRVELTENYALTDTQLGDGYVLLCSGKPATDQITLAYE